MWTVRFGGSSANLLGYAQFPEANNVPGVCDGNGAANTDGLVMVYNAFGSMDYNDGTNTVSKVAVVSFRPRAIESLELMPNPAVDQLGVLFQAPENGEVQVTVLDGLGKVVYQHNAWQVVRGLNRTSLDLTQHPEGIYYLRIAQGTSFVHKKFLKQ